MTDDPPVTLVCKAGGQYEPADEAGSSLPAAPEQPATDPPQEAT